MFIPLKIVDEDSIIMLITDIMELQYIFHIDVVDTPRISIIFPTDLRGESSCKV